NDDDVTNMMEEYDKLGSSDGFTRLRIFLFSHRDHDGSSHFIDGDERETERRYVDALNNLNDNLDFRKLQLLDSPSIIPPDEIHAAEQFFNTMSIEGSLHSQRSCEMPMTQYNLHHLTVPHMGSGQHQQPITQRYNEMDGTWSPAYYSPRHHAPLDPRSIAEFPSSPSSARFRVPFGELPDKGLDRLPDEYTRQQTNHHPTYDHQPHPDNVMWMPAGSISGDKNGFPGNILNGPAVYEGTVCDHCRVTFHRNQPPSEQPNMGNGLPQIPIPAAECPPNRESFKMNTDAKFHHGIYPKDHNDPRCVYSETYSHERGWILPHPLNPRVEETRAQISSSGRVNDHYLVDGSGMNFPIGHGNLVDGHPISSNYVPHRAGPEMSTDGFHDPTLTAHAHLHVPSAEERAVRYGNYSYAHGADNVYPVSHGHGHPQTLWRNIPNHVSGAPSYEASGLPPQVNGTVNPTLLRAPAEGSTRFRIGLDNQNPWIDQSQKMLGYKDHSAPLEDAKLSVNRLSFLPELIASVKKAALEEAEEVKANAEENVDSVEHNLVEKEVALNKSEPLNAQGDLELDSDTDSTSISKIEPTKAEAEAIARGLQTIRNDDLEEIRELGSGTYGAVYHGKWKGSDVAIKRIKASCFAGRPSERERLIADFWKEALMLSSLHHPNVVSFYGIVRDGPDGSLATVTEFMVNGSLKQFLQKKDRTIDRRKRLIIAMDAAFGMEYLHGKNIVHFDLKCENLLVNMRDPQRPVCKIGDLGLSKVKQHTLVSGGVRGTLPWMAPELLSGKSNMVTEKIDVYSFGIVMWELLTGEEPYADMHCASIIGGIVNNSLRPNIPSWCDPEWKALMESCWASDPAERPSFSEISQKLRNMAAAINVK
ncbi:uncharacterized protein LOC110811072, partial [Carica papaya]|uniref:uncharacterized protein LOC110811072 n=1 Tax=Carica papaya TaxID=3649 RepID=UPI000B8D0666